MVRADVFKGFFGGLEQCGSADNFNPSVSSGLTSSSLSNLGVEDLSGVEWVKFFFGGTQFRIRKANTNRLYEKFRKKSKKKGLRAECTARSPMVANFVRDFTDAPFASMRSSPPPTLWSPSR